MRVDRCAIGVIRKRGAESIDAQLLNLGSSESDYFLRHVSKIRENSTSRALFRQPSSVPSLLGDLQTCGDASFVTGAVILQKLLASSMRTAVNAKDCVFAVIRVVAPNADVTVSLLKLDAVIEAARFEMLKTGRITFEVLHQLLPEPGELQKGLSWPDPRTDSEVIMVDRNVVSALYFENAFDVNVSPRSVDAERDLARRITERVAPDRVPQAISAAGALSGPADEVLRELGQQFPELAAEAEVLATEPRPAGHIRANKIGARKVIFRADGVEVHVPPELVPDVQIRAVGDEWEIAVRTRARPQIG